MPQRQATPQRPQMGDLSGQLQALRGQMRGQMPQPQMPQMPNMQRPQMPQMPQQGQQMPEFPKFPQFPQQRCQ